MRVIFSRKGFDLAAGGCPSPIIAGRPITLPIPTRQPTPTTYAHLLGDHAALVTDLTNGRLGPDTPCHLDPDIDPTLLPRPPGWRGAFGQIGAALAHLRNQRVGPGDLFLFWGSYRPAIRIAPRWAPRWAFYGPTVHLLFGWLQVGAVHPLGPDGSPILRTHPWLEHHPHARPGWPAANALYIAADALAAPGLPSHAPGFGLFPNPHALTAPGALPSLWRAPDWLHPATGGPGMSYHPANRWRPDGTVRCVAQGQEFVADIGTDPRFGAWLARLMG